MKKYLIGIIVLVVTVLSVSAIDDQQLFIHSKGSVVTVPVDSIDSVAYIANRQQKIFNRQGNVLDARLVSQIDSMTIGAEDFPMAFTTSKWEISSSIASSNESSWVNNNKIYATAGSKEGTSYISTTSGGNQSQPFRALDGSNLSVSNLYTNDAINFTIPVTTLAKGSIVDFMLTIYTPSSKSPKYWIFEYEDNGQWKTVDEDLKTATEDPNLKYSFYIKYFSSALYTTFIQSFKTPRTLKNKDLKMRCRVVGDINNAGGKLTADKTAFVGLVNSYYRSCYINSYQSVPVKDTLKIAVLGNSFTYYYGAPFMLKEIAMSQGHSIRMRSSLKGSQSFGDHMQLELSKGVINEGGYDYAILQDVSTNHAYYYSDTIGKADILNNSIEIVKQLKEKSPNIQPIIENTWSYAASTGSYMGYVNYDGFDHALQNGSIMICAKSGAWESPVGIAFQKARAAGISALYHTDNKHPNRNGAYLKACVDYLLIYGEPFDDNVPDCLVNSTTARQLRSIAEEVVFKDIDSWKSPDLSKVSYNTTPQAPDTVKLDSIVAGENGIRTPEQLLSFAAIWNSGGDVSSYKNSEGEIALLSDLNLAGYQWTPIGECPSGASFGSSTSSTHNAKYPFTLVFNGNGHTISGLKLETKTDQIFGMFGVVKGGTIKNLNLDASCTMKVNRTAIANGNSYGMVVGYLTDGVVKDCNVSGTISECLLNGSGMACISGIIGYALATNTSTLVENCTFNGSINNVSSNVMDNSNCAACAGIIGYARATASKKYYTIKNCTNNGMITASFHRTAGVIASTTCGMHMIGCVNNGTITNTLDNNSKGNRVGGLLGLDSNTSNSYDDYMDGCANYGTIISASSVVNGQEIAGGLAGIFRRVNVKNCLSNCVIIAPTNVYSRGVFCGSVTDNYATFSNNKVVGGLATGTDGDGNYLDYITLTAQNYGTYMGSVGSSYTNDNFNTTNIKFGE